MKPIGDPHPDTYTGWESASKRVLSAVLAERWRQVAKYGLNRGICDGSGPDTRWLLPYTNIPSFFANQAGRADSIESTLRDDYEDFVAETGAPTWVHLVREEVAEAFCESDPAKLEAELIQVAALCVSWVERIRERGAKPCEVED